MRVQITNKEIDMSIKQCKQCGRTLNIVSFRPYYSRRNDDKPSNSGHNTVCRDCEAFNAKVNRMAKIVDPTAEQQKLLDEAANFYRVLASRGLHPIGVYASEVLGRDTRGRKTIDMMDFMNEIMKPKDEIVAEYEALEKLELVDEPDVYQEMLEAIREKSAGLDGKVKPCYADIFDKVAKRIDEYEDNYKWA